MYFIERKLGKQIIEAAQHFPAIMLAGPRQTGKTELLKRLFPAYNYVTLDKPITAEQAENDPEAFLTQHPTPVLIDEVQYAPSIFKYIKIKIDENRNLKGQFILTGSQKFTLLKNASESLAGRVAIFDFEGLSCLELLEANKIENTTEHIIQLLLRGGYPELWQDTSRPTELYLSSYIATYLERDIRQILAVGSLRDFERFLRACALRSAQQLNKSELARDVGISVTTIGEWLRVLEALGQIVLIEPWFGNLNKRLVKSPKLYLTETALMCILSNVREDNILNSPIIGSLWETLVLAELRKQLSFLGRSSKIFYYRDQSQIEADFIIENGFELDLYECKWTSSPSISLANNLNKIEKIFLENSNQTHKIKTKKLISRASEHFKQSDLNFCSLFDNLVG